MTSPDQIPQVWGELIIEGEDSNKPAKVSLPNGKDDSEVKSGEDEGDSGGSGESADGGFEMFGFRIVEEDGIFKGEVGSGEAKDGNFEGLRVAITVQSLAPCEDNSCESGFIEFVEFGKDDGLEGRGGIGEGGEESSVGENLNGENEDGVGEGSDDQDDVFEGKGGIGEGGAGSSDGKNLNGENEDGMGEGGDDKDDGFEGNGGIGEGGVGSSDGENFNGENEDGMGEGGDDKDDGFEGKGGIGEGGAGSSDGENLNGENEDGVGEGSDDQDDGFEGKGGIGEGGAGSSDGENLNGENEDGVGEGSDDQDDVFEGKGGIGEGGAGSSDGENLNGKNEDGMGGGGDGKDDGFEGKGGIGEGGEGSFDLSGKIEDLIGEGKGGRGEGEEGSGDGEGSADNDQEWNDVVLAGIRELLNKPDDNDEDNIFDDICHPDGEYYHSFGEGFYPYEGRDEDSDEERNLQVHFLPETSDSTDSAEPILVMPHYNNLNEGGAMPQEQFPELDDDNEDDNNFEYGFIPYQHNLELEDEAVIGLEFQGIPGFFLPLDPFVPIQPYPTSRGL